MEETYDELREYCQDQAGRSLQSIFTYTENSAELYYVRDDMEDAFRGGGFQAFQEAAWAVHTTILEEEVKVEVLGGYRATVHTFETAFAIQFRIDDGEGLVVTFDRDIGRNLHQFLIECERYI